MEIWVRTFVPVMYYPTFHSFGCFQWIVFVPFSAEYAFMGSLIIREVIKDLTSKGMKQAKVVMLSGSRCVCIINWRSDVDHRLEVSACGLCNIWTNSITSIRQQKPYFDAPSSQQWGCFQSSVISDIMSIKRALTCKGKHSSKVSIIL